MTESQDQELEYVPINEKSILSDLVIRLLAISDPDLLDSSIKSQLLVTPR